MSSHHIRWKMNSKWPKSESLEFENGCDKIAITSFVFFEGSRVAHAYLSVLLYAKILTHEGVTCWINEFPSLRVMSKEAVFVHLCLNTSLHDPYKQRDKIIIAIKNVYKYLCFRGELNILLTAHVIYSKFTVILT